LLRKVDDAGTRLVEMLQPRLARGGIQFASNGAALLLRVEPGRLHARCCLRGKRRVAQRDQIDLAASSTAIGCSRADHQHCIRAHPLPACVIIRPRNVLRSSVAPGSILRHEITMQKRVNPFVLGHAALVQTAPAAADCVRAHRLVPWRARRRPGSIAPRMNSNLNDDDSIPLLQARKNR
jgi:hypothetical protein